MDKKIKEQKWRLLCVGMAILVVLAIYSVLHVLPGLTKPTDLFIDTCKKVFYADADYIALDKEQKDVTADFVAKYTPAIQQEDYETLWKAFKEELSAITWNISEEKDVDGVTEQIIDQKYYLVDSTKTLRPNRTFELLLSAKSTQHKDENGKVLDKTPVELSLESSNAGRAYRCLPTSNTEIDGGNGEQIYIVLQAKYGIGTSVQKELLGPYSVSMAGDLHEN